MNVSLPDELRPFVDEQVDDGRYGSTSEYVSCAIPSDAYQDRQRLRNLRLDGAVDPPARTPTDLLDFEELPSCIRASDERRWPSRRAGAGPPKTSTTHSPTT